MPTIEPITHKYGYSEVSPFDDSRPNGFSGFNNSTDERSIEERKQWSEDTAHLANHSIYSHLAEMILKIPSYFISHSDLKNEWWAKGMFVIERITGTFGDMFRNLIYGHKDKNGNLDDNIGAEVQSGANKNFSIGVINNQAQTKGKFLIAALGLISPTLANDLEWALVRALDGVWWRSMGMHLAYGPNFGTRVFKALFGQKSGSDKEEDKISLGIIANKIKSHFNKTIECWNNISKTTEEGKEDNYLGFCQNADKLISSFLPVANCLNLIGDWGRPIVRRLGIEGVPRNLFRILSIIDRPFFWFTNIFRFYMPEKYIENKQAKDEKQKVFNHISTTDLLLGSVVGDILDFGLVVFEDRIKDSSGSLNHIIEIARRMKNSAEDIYFSARRKRAYEDIRKTEI